MKLSLKRVYAKPNNTSIIIYYSKDGKEMRFPTGISISAEKYNKTGRYKQWDYTANMLKPGIKDYESSKKKIEDLVNKGNDILISLFNNNITPTVAELENLLVTQEEKTIANSNALITELYQLFYNIKSAQFAATNTLISLKDFTSTKNLINDFETYTNRNYKIYQLNNTWCREMLNFMRIPHVDEVLTGKKYKTDGALGPKTCRKRFDIFIQFAEYLKENKIYSQETIDELKKFRRTNIKVPKPDKITLDIDEIHELYEYKFDKKKHEIISDVFVFICVTGLRFTDYKIFNKNFIQKSRDSETLIYERKATKTKGSSGLNYKIPLCEIAIEIIKKYDYKLPLPSNPNEDIKNALKEANLFTQSTNIIDKKTGIEKLRFECISMHKGRDSFITNLVDSTPLNAFKTLNFTRVYRPTSKY